MYRNPGRKKGFISPSLTYIHGERNDMHYFNNNKIDGACLNRNIVHLNNKVSKSFTSKFNTLLNFDF